MTKIEFQEAAQRLKIDPAWYGMKIAGSVMTSGGFPVSGGKIIGLTTLNEWKTRSEWSRYLGRHDVTTLVHVPYVIIKKNQEEFLVEADRIEIYLSQKCREWLADQKKSGAGI